MYNLKRMYKHKYRTLPVLHCGLSDVPIFFQQFSFVCCSNERTKKCKSVYLLFFSMFMLLKSQTSAIKFVFSFIPYQAKKKIGVFTVCRPTLFYSCRPYHFFSKTKKNETVVGPCSCCPRFKYWYSNFSLILFYSVCSQAFYGYLRILSIQDGDVLVAFSFKKCDHQDQKSLFEATSHHLMTWDI